jgi:hypothetical protein
VAQTATKPRPGQKKPEQVPTYLTREEVEKILQPLALTAQDGEEEEWGDEDDYDFEEDPEDAYIVNRVMGVAMIMPAQVHAHEDNWRTHPEEQKKAMEGVLKQIGMAGALLAYFSEKYNGEITYVDGHLRKEMHPRKKWPTLVLDINDEEADLVLATHDPLSAMAEADAAAFETLHDRINTDDLEVREMLRKLANESTRLADEAEEAANEGELAEIEGPADMGILPFEHYDYIMLPFKRHQDWLQALDLFNIEKRGDPRVGPTKNPANRIGLCRVVDGASVVKMILTGSHKLEGSDVPLPGVTDKGAAEKLLDSANEFKADMEAASEDQLALRIQHEKEAERDGER